MKVTVITALIVVACANSAFAWTCANHTLIASQSGLSNENACITDNRRDFKHYVNNKESDVVDAADFTSENTGKGDLYAKIYILSKQMYDGQKIGEKDRQDFVHAIGDLSNPMHNVVYEGFNQANHKKYDGMKMSSSCIDKSLSYDIKSHREFLERAAEVAAAAKDKGYHDIDGNSMTFSKEEACEMASMSIALLKSVRSYLTK